MYNEFKLISILQNNPCIWNQISIQSKCNWNFWLNTGKLTSNRRSRHSTQKIQKKWWIWFDQIPKEKSNSCIRCYNLSKLKNLGLRFLCDRLLWNQRLDRNCSGMYSDIKPMLLCMTNNKKCSICFAFHSNNRNHMCECVDVCVAVRSAWRYMRAVCVCTYVLRRGEGYLIVIFVWLY